jgi:hypothetical protein
MPSSKAELADRMAHRRGVEAVIWGMPAVNTELMKYEMLGKTQGEVNQVLYWSKPADAKNQTLTPNPDAIYFMIFYDTRDAGALVMEIPPADTGSFAGNVVDVWQTPLDDLGPAGADKGAGGRYLILSPDDAGPAPDGYIALKSDTYTGYALLRSNLASHSEADIAKAVAYGKRVKVYPFSQAASPPETRFADAEGILFDSTIRYDLGFFEFLAGVVQTEPWLARDRAMIDPLRTIGIEKGKSFNPDARTRWILMHAIREAQSWLEMRYDADPEPFFSGTHWRSPVSPELVKGLQTSYSDSNSYPVDDRAMAYTFAFVGIKRLGAAQFYLLTIKDREGRAFDGGKTYRLVVPPNVPARQYWSATVYDRARHTVLDTSRASCASNDTAVKANADGSVDVYFGPKAPAGKEANWVPTTAGRRFEVLFRLYGPEKPLFEKTWTLPDIASMKGGDSRLK